jgi:hypothetical protein
VHDIITNVVVAPWNYPAQAYRFYDVVLFRPKQATGGVTKLSTGGFVLYRPPNSDDDVMMLVVGLAVLKVASKKDSEVRVVMAPFQTGSTLKSVAESGGLASSSLARVKVMETPLSTEFDATKKMETVVGFGDQFFALHPEQEETSKTKVKSTKDDSMVPSEGKPARSRRQTKPYSPSSVNEKVRPPLPVSHTLTLSSSKP